MHTCKNCGSFHEVLQLDFAGFGEDENEDLIVSLHVCVRCLRELGLYCGEHGAHICMEDQGSTPEKLVVQSVCRGCVLETIQALDDAVVDHYAEILLHSFGQSYLGDLNGTEFFHEESLDSKRQVLFSLLIVGKLFGRTLEQAITDIVVERAGATTLLN